MVGVGVRMNEAAARNAELPLVLDQGFASPGGGEGL